MKGSTKDAHIGRSHDGTRLVNPGTEIGSTVLFPDYEAFTAKVRPFHYGRMGTSTHRAFEDTLCALENADAAFLTPSGLSAISLALLSVVNAGSHILVADTVYAPTRFFCDNALAKLGVETTYVDPLIGRGIASLIRPNTAAIFMESPGSLTFEMSDIRAIIGAAGSIPVIVDNTWAAGVYHQPISLGAAISLHSISKYVGGHSDLVMGAVMTAPGITKRAHKAAQGFGYSVSARDVTAAHKGARTLHRRLEVHESTGLALARWLDARPEVAKVLHPALPDHPQHSIWQRDFSGSSGLFSFIANWSDEESSSRFINSLKFFGLGYGWGGFESLCLPAWPTDIRTAVPWTETGALFRVHAGLEQFDDLTYDLEQAFVKVADK